MKTEFKVGDRVAAYQVTCEGLPAKPLRRTGKIHSLTAGIVAEVRMDNGYSTIYVHINQLRLLKKKVRRTVWITEDALGLVAARPSGFAACVSATKISPGDREFREVVRKK